MLTKDYTPESLELYRESIKAIDKQHTKILEEAKKHYLTLKEELARGAQDARDQAKSLLVPKEDK